MMLSLTENLKDSTAKSMVVNGTSVNKVYSYSPGSGTVAVAGITLILDDPGGAAFNKFGSITALTNGLVLSVTINSVTTTLTTIKDNADLVTRFQDSHFGNSASDTLGGAVGFGESYDAFVGRMRFESWIVLTGSDSIQMTVKDDLSAISTLQVACSLLKEV